MTLKRGHRLAQQDSGIALIEVLISALIIATVSAGIFGVLQTSARSAADQRHKSEAYAVAQEDQARLRSMRISELNRLKQTRTVSLNGGEYTVVSTGLFVNDSTATASCGQGSSSADYVQVASKVSWPGLGTLPPVEIQSIISPANGSLDPTHGTLTVSAMNSQGSPIPGIGLSGSGAGTFSGTTDANGCATFPDQQMGTYTMTPSGVAAGLVDKDGNAPGPISVGVVGSSTTPVTLLYDLPGSIPAVTFLARPMGGGTPVETKADSIVVFNTGMTTAKTFGTVGAPVSSIQATSLFPFSSPDTVYAGTCGENNPNPNGETGGPGAAAMASLTVPPGGPSPPATLQLPALDLTVKSGASTVLNAKVTITDDKCTVGGNPVKRTYFTEAGGVISPRGLPWGVYDICASANFSSTNHRMKAEKVTVENLAANTVLTLDLSGTGSESGSTKTC